MELLPLIISIIAAIIAIAPALLRMESEKRKDSADAAGTLTSGAMEMVTKWEARVVALESQVSRLERDNEIWKAGVYILIGQLTEIGCEPAWRPPEGKDENTERS